MAWIRVTVHQTVCIYMCLSVSAAVAQTDFYFFFFNYWMQQQATSVIGVLVLGHQDGYDGCDICCNNVAAGGFGFFCNVTVLLM